ncbi:hypothetical protein GSI_04640 [Ganoderma sinense ZZ0214-1]|uniref:F-box domain-containing protein n=1 Tax=Ganoderma sinense ZZ0214-1 TaxID=1077348 RepID=A0A2G8SHE6_9APHY|nr:hypothetical protein GSI_04640 [Ganoderma sinense ZZ0214-1]
MARVAETLVELPFPHLWSFLPVADRASLVGLSPNDIRAWTSARADEYCRFARALLSIYNAVAPIHSLPAEILSKIFEECWTGRKSLRIGHVCRQWRSVLLDSKRFWADAVKGGKFTLGDYHTGYLGAMLERSSPRRIEPSLSRFPADVSRCLAPHSDRVISLEVSRVTIAVLLQLWACLNSGMPCLTTLTLTVDEEDFRWILHTPTKNLSLSPTALPRLTRVSAPVVLLPSLNRSSLQHLTLTNPITREYDNGRLQNDSFFKALALCAPNLQTLSLSEATPWLFNLTAPPFVLPALRHLHIQDVARRCDLLLDRLALPLTTRIHCTNIDGLGLCLTAPPSAPSIQSALSMTDRVAIVCTVEAVSVHCYARDSDEALLHVDVGPPAVRPQAVDRLGPSDLIEFFRDLARATQLTVAGCIRSDMQAALEWRAFPHLVRAEVRGRGAKYAVKNLARWQLGDGDSTPAHWQAGSSPATTVVCPGLKMLAVDFQFILGPQRTDGLGEALRRGDVAGVEADLRKRCADLEHALSFRSEMGTRLARLEFGCTEQDWSEGLNERKGTRDPLNPGWTSWRPIVEPLEKLVDGAVVFTGYRYLLADG